MTELSRIELSLDCGMVGSNDQVIIVNCEDAGISMSSDHGEPSLSYSLAQRTNLQVVYRNILPMRETHVMPTNILIQ